MKTEVKPGLWVILGTIVIYYSGSFVSLVALERMSKRTDSENLYPRDTLCRGAKSGTRNRFTDAR